MFPLRVVIESVAAGECLECCRSGAGLADSYAIVSGQTPLSQLVDTVLGALQLPQLSTNARGVSFPAHDNELALTYVQPFSFQD